MTAPRDYRDYLNEIINASRAAVSFLDGVTYEDFTRNQQKTYAVLHALAVVGEATKRIPTEILNQYPEIPWRDVAGMRDNSAHGYFGLDLKIVWDTLRNDLPPIIEVTQQILADYQSSDA